METINVHNDGKLSTMKIPEELKQHRFADSTRVQQEITD